MTAIQTEGLTKRFDNGRGCSDVSINVREGEAFGFLGPNGAGKSTCVKMLVGLIFPTEGRASLFGEPIGSLAARRLIGYLPELYRYQEWLTGEEVVRLHARLCRLPRAEADRRVPQLLERVGIGLRSRDRVKNYSKGMQQRLGLACALVGDPRILFLDEPSSAMDPIGRSEVRELLHELKAQGKTIFLNSHLMEDVESLCDRVALLNNGRILQQGTVEEVLQQRPVWRLRVGGFIPSLLDWLTGETGLAVRLADSEPDGSAVLEVELENDEQAGWLHATIMDQGMTLYESARARTRLEEWFVTELSGKSHRGEKA
ncbi:MULTISPECIES: ABC transporter ATP-binding protein [unclassified Paenibacillus]|uniref:ABC transporter ATP-binding protein n=1 Tax=unclassified Paenibacillus TaxID=185978 RepID=UPI000955138D|nr:MULTISPECIES: ABC transporter ATP-binding protein [unclassified Paenibacillus]SIR39248.1 ABC-2 type transport system ATP-binding protein [Paenibacillus sp. RU4X]SIR49712.1 ABC-2 type transport system ATP-binding protein [Paenibacillus sp. RU4T]